MIARWCSVALLIAGAAQAGDVVRADQAWPRARAGQVGLDGDRLERGVRAVQEMRGTRALLVARHGRLVVERTFHGRPNQPHNFKSATKSVLSALVGIALAEGHLEDVDQAIAAFLPELRQAHDARGRITIEHLLTMTSGLQSTSGQAYGAWVSSRDWVRFALTRELIAPPGRRFAYSTGNTHLLSAILMRATGVDTRTYLERELFGPLGITIESWDRSPRGVPLGGNNLVLTPRELAAFGQLYLRSGEWGGRQLVPRDWVARSTRPHAEGWPDRYGAYGYLWWLPPIEPAGSFLASGYAGQFLLVSPQRDIVIVLVSNLEPKGADWDRRMLGIFEDLILGAAADD